MPQKVIIKGEEYLVEYLGDGVYALVTNNGVWLHANDHENPTDKIFLEPKVYANLKRFMDNLNEKVR
jgi:hypothetical protein